MKIGRYSAKASIKPRKWKEANRELGEGKKLEETEVGIHLYWRSPGG